MTYMTVSIYVDDPGPVCIIAVFDDDLHMLKTFANNLFHFVVSFESIPDK